MLLGRALHGGRALGDRWARGGWDGAVNGAVRGTEAAVLRPLVGLGVLLGGGGGG